MTLDDVLPAPHWRTRNERHVPAPPDAALTAARTVTVVDMPLAAAAARPARPRAAAADLVCRAARGGVGMARLGEDVSGGVLRPWRVCGRSRRVDDLAAFAEPGWVKVAADLTATPAGAGTLLATETRMPRPAERRGARSAATG